MITYSILGNKTQNDDTKKSNLKKKKKNQNQKI